MKRTVCLAVAFSIALSGCGFASFKPAAPPVIPHASEPSNLSVGLVSEGSEVGGNFYLWGGFGTGTPNEIAPAMPRKLAEGLRQSGAFKNIQFPLYGVRPDDIDLVLSVRMAFQFVTDPMWFAKAFLTGFTLYLADPIMWYRDKYNANADLVVRDADSREIARYSETFRVDISHLMILPGGADEMLRNAADIAITGLTAKFAEDILRDLSKLKEAAAGIAADRAPQRQQYDDSLRPVAKQVPAASPLSDVDDVPEGPSTPRKGHAVIIGIERYRQQGMPIAEFADDDAKLVAKYITKTLGFPEENVAVLIDGDATKSDFEKYFESWLPNRVEKGDEVFVYFSGHGAPNPATRDAYLVPYDGDPTYLSKTGYPVEQLYAQLAKLPAAKITVALDSCFSGAGGHSVIAAGARPLVNIVQAHVPPRVSVLAATSSEQISNSYQSKGHGLFTYFFLKGIKAHGDDFKATFDYLKPEVSRVARREFNANQDPVFIGGAP